MAEGHELKRKHEDDGSGEDLENTNNSAKKKKTEVSDEAGPSTSGAGVSRGKCAVKHIAQKSLNSISRKVA